MFVFTQLCQATAFTASEWFVVLKKQAPRYHHFQQLSAKSTSSSDQDIAATGGIAISSARQRFERTPDSKIALDEPCIITIDNRRYNLTAWGKLI